MVMPRIILPARTQLPEDDEAVFEVVFDFNKESVSVQIRVESGFSFSSIW